MFPPWGRESPSTCFVLAVSHCTLLAKLRDLTVLSRDLDAFGDSNARKKHAAAA